jgi:predicted metal-dependent enzyme (double-stranded beta helix superfamily)
MTLSPHDHNMIAVIGIYSGREDNILWRRCADGRIEAAGAKAISERETVTLGRDIVRSVTNPIPRFTAALHVYAGDFFNTPRSQWNAESLEPAPFSARAMRFFEEWNGLIPPERLVGISLLANHRSPPR